MATKEEKKNRAKTRVKNDTYVTSNKLTDDETIEGLHRNIFGTE